MNQAARRPAARGERTRRSGNRAASEHENRLREAIGHYQAGRLNEAAEICEAVLARHPAEPDALHLLGAVAIAAGDLARAADPLGELLEIQPGDAQARGNLGSVLERQGDLRGAADS